MSTILRALQKVETNHTKNVQQLGPVHPVKTSDTISKRLTSLWYRQLGKRLLWIGSSVAVVLLTLMVMINIFGKESHKKSPSQISPTKKSEVQKPLPHRIPSLKSKDQRIQIPGPTRPKTLAPKPSYDPNYRPDRFANKFPAPNASSKNWVNTPKTKTSPPLETETISPGSDTNDLSLKSDDSPTKEATQPKTPVEILEDDPEELRYAQVDLLENDALELQAISYAKSPNQRIAVINNEIMHQGQSLSGYKIIYIGPEEVVVEQGQAQWKLIFMVR
jgi:hypothetical protein